MDQSSSVVSRRQAVGLVGMGIAGAAASGAVGPPTPSPNAPLQPAKDDPRAKYPKPPFQEQTQAWPGLALSDAS